MRVTRMYNRQSLVAIVERTGIEQRVSGAGLVAVELTASLCFYISSSDCNLVSIINK